MHSHYSIDTSPFNPTHATILQLTHYFPQGYQHIRLPTVLIRTPYYRQLFSFLGNQFASQGYHVVIQDCRRKFAKTNEEEKLSTGEFPLQYEDLDGVATVQWIMQQSFFDGNVGMYGISYLGLTQWAVIDLLAQRGISCVKCLAPVNCANNVYDFIFPNGALHFDLLLIWLQIMLQIQVDDMSKLERLKQAVMSGRIAKQAFASSPLVNLDKNVFGRDILFMKEILMHPDEEDEFWDNKGKMMRKLCNNLENCPPIALFAGWYDCFFRFSIKDYEELKKSSKNNVMLTIGPWTHWQVFHQLSVSLSETFDVFDHYLKGSHNISFEERLRKPVKVYIMGLKKWILMESFPPKSPHASHKSFELRTNRSLVEADQLLYTVSDEQKSNQIRIDYIIWDTFEYDPKNPTPSVGGPSFDPSNTGKMNQSSVESRSDVLVFTSDPFIEPLIVLGKVFAILFVSSTNQSAQFVARLCDVYPNGKSVIICDGLCTLSPDMCIISEEQELEIVGKKLKLHKSVYRVEIDLSATGNMFRKGHQLRLQIAGGAHPRWSRTFGSDSKSFLHADEATDSVRSENIVYYGCGSGANDTIRLNSRLILQCVSSQFIQEEEWVFV